MNNNSYNLLKLNMYIKNWIKINKMSVNNKLYEKKNKYTI